MFSYLHQPKGFYKHLFLLALPVIVQNLITTSLGFLDTFMVGLLGSDQMSAVTVANVPVFIIQLVVFGLQSGSSVLISQYWGRGDRESINRVMGIGFMIAGGVSVLFAAILCAFPAQVLYLITDNLTLVELAEPYLRIVGFSYIFNSLSSIYIGMQRSIENPRFGMIVFAISMLCNTLGNYVLIFGKLGLPVLGITGAAVATLLSRVVEFVVAFSYAFRCRTMPLMKHAILRPGMDMLRKFLRYSAPVLINETLWGTGFSMITVIMGHMANSSDLIAAYTLAGNIDKLMTSGVFGIAAAVVVFYLSLTGEYGGPSYGMRYLVPVIPVFWLVISRWILSWKQAVWKAAAGGCRLFYRLCLFRFRRVRLTHPARAASRWPRRGSS